MRFRSWFWFDRRKEWPAALHDAQDLVAEWEKQGQIYIATERAPYYHGKGDQLRFCARQLKKVLQ